MKVKESLNVTFDETPPPPKTSPLEDDELVEEQVIEKQTALATSTTEVEYVSARKACQQALWMKQALVDYGIRHCLIVFASMPGLNIRLCLQPCGFHYGGASLDCVRMDWGSFAGNDGFTTHDVFDAAQGELLDLHKWRMYSK
nr:putative polyprotein [Tanacetum cinerariifolium]